MTEDFQRWLCKKAGYFIDVKFVDGESEIYPFDDIDVTLLVEAMWKVNEIALMKSNITSIWIEQLIDSFDVEQNQNITRFWKGDYNDSMKEALEAALKYIYEQEKK